MAGVGDAIHFVLRDAVEAGRKWSIASPVCEISTCPMAAARQGWGPWGRPSVSEKR